MQIHIAKLNLNVPVTDFDQWSPAAVSNAIVVGLGRILNDAVAGVARKDFKSDSDFRDFAMRKIQTRLANLRNADQRISSPMTERVRAVADKVDKISDEQFQALLELLDANQSAAA